MRCLETRITPEGFKRRRYVAEDGTRHSTIEVPIALWREHYGRDATRRAGMAMLAAGKTVDEVTKATGVHPQTVRSWRRRP